MEAKQTITKSLAEHHEMMLVEESRIDPEVVETHSYRTAIQKKPGLQRFRPLGYRDAPHPEARGVFTSRKAEMASSLIPGDGAVGLWALAVKGG